MLEYDFVLQPGSRHEDVQFLLEGAEDVQIDSDGSLLVIVAGQRMRHALPRVFQESEGQRIPIEGRFVLRDEGRIGFESDGYDPRFPLAIDPELVYVSSIRCRRAIASLPERRWRDPPRFPFPRIDGPAHSGDE